MIYLIGFGFIDIATVLYLVMFLFSNNKNADEPWRHVLVSIQIMIFTFAVLIIFYRGGLFVQIVAVIDIVLLYLEAITIFALLYKKIGIQINGNVTNAPLPWDCFYLSVITWTTVGFGDIAPSEKSRRYAACEAVLGYCSMALLAAVLIKVLGG